MNRKQNIYEPELIGNVVSFLKSTKSIVNVSESNGISTITTNSIVLLPDLNPFNLQSGMFIEIDSKNYQVLSVSDYQFTIAATGITGTTWNLAVNFLFGSRIEINEVLAYAANEPTLCYNQYPLIWLFINNERNHTDEKVDFITNLQFAFVHLTNKEYRAQDRLTNVFKPVLAPLVQLFLETLNSSFFKNLFYFETRNLEYSEFYRYFYGSSDKNLNVLSTPTDAIEIEINVGFVRKFC